MNLSPPESVCLFGGLLYAAVQNDPGAAPPDKEMK